MDEYFNTKQPKVRQGDSKKEIFVLIFFAVITSVLWQFQIGIYILYPFTILGTWFHEMSHGLAAMALGGDFRKLELFWDGSGIATHSGGLFLGGIGNAIVAAAGPLGPAIFGSIIIVSTKSQKLTRFFLYFLSILMLLSVLIWIRTLFGIIIISLMGIGIFFAAKKISENKQKLFLQFLGIQAISSIYLSIGYLYSSGAEIEGAGYYSDTQVIQNNLFLPYWFWATAILIFSAIIMIISLRSVYLKEKS
ncbi:MAG: hypothetical protein A2X64_10730 [Ignavibacteria bacterium GWF2_33_9]|nr:MAG: hypothetical protein A2X64_10730 [Ignavibacteria bacterium GWF2_33_9]